MKRDVAEQMTFVAIRLTVRLLLEKSLICCFCFTLLACICADCVGADGADLCCSADAAIDGDDDAG